MGGPTTRLTDNRLGLSLNGSTQYADLPTLDAANVGINMTICYWMYPVAAGGSTMINSDVTGAGGRSTIFYPVSTQVGIEYTTGAGNTPNFWGTGFTPTLNQWSHCVVTFSTNTIAFYANGTLYSSTATPNVTPSSGHYFRFGRWNSGDPRWFNGSLADVRVYNRVLTATEIARIYQGLQ